jgi:S-adenosylmethionine synthetase
MYKKQSYLFTSESVTEGHPDKLCDQISDAVLDAIFEKDPNARVACESSVSSDLIVLSGEITTNSSVDFLKIVRDTIRNIGYTSPEVGLDADTCKILIALNKQSSDIAMGVNQALEAREGLMTEDEIDQIGAGV